MTQSEDPLKIGFSEEGMLLEGCIEKVGLREGREVDISYEMFDTMIDIEDVCLLFGGNQVLVLQKRDLVSETYEEFYQFLKEKLGEGRVVKMI